MFPRDRRHLRSRHQTLHYPKGSAEKRKPARIHAGKSAPEMTAVPNSPPAPVGQQAPPARDAASAVGGTQRRARVPPVDYRDGLLPCPIKEVKVAATRLTRTKIENII